MVLGILAVVVLLAQAVFLIYAATSKSDAGGPPDWR